MRVLFLNPVPPEGKKVYTGYNHGIGCLSSVAKRAGHETSLVTFARPDEAVIKEVSDRAPHVVAMTATSAQWPLAAWAAEKLSTALPSVPVIAGGVHSTVATDEVISTPGVWAACRGEGERALVEILNRLEDGGWEKTRGFWARPRAAAEIVRNEPPALVDITRLPHPDREIYDYQAVLDRNRPNVGAEFLASRGCPYECSYCVNPVMSELTGGAWKKVRYREVEDVVSEIETVLARYGGVELLGFHDDIFGLDKAWLRAFAEEYRARVGLPFWCNQRIGTFGEDDVRVLKEAGCFRVHVGLESADDHLRREVLGRDISREAIEEAFALLKRHDLKTVAFNMIGIPHETEETIRATIALNRRIRPDWMVVSIFSPFPGTRLRQVALENGWITRALPGSYYDGEWALEQPSLPRERLLYYYENFVPLVFNEV